MRKTNLWWLAALMIPFYCYAQSSSEPIKIGLVGPITGPSASFGEQMLQGAKQAVHDLNLAGGIHGHPIELVSTDDACDPKQAVFAAQRLIHEENVKIVIGHFCSSSTLPASTIYSDANVLMITPASTNPLITERNLPTLFRMCGRDDQQGYVAAQFIHNILHAKRVAIIHDKDAYGKGLADATAEALKTLKTPIVLYEGLTRGEKDFNALATKIKAANADCVYFGGVAIEAGTFLRQLREQNVTAAFVTGDGIVSRDFVTAAGGPAMIQNVYMTFSADPRQSPDAQKTVELFRKNGYEPEGYTLYTYAAFQAAAQALQQAGNDGEKMAAWLHHNSVKTLLGERQWNIKGDLTNADYIVYQWDTNGKYKPYSGPATP